MKCKYCGGDVTLNDHFCPHCGRPVDQAQRHQREMRQYETEFEETKQEAIDKISVSSGGGTAVGIRLAVIVALVAALITSAATLNPYAYNERKMKKEAAKNYDSYVAQIETYLSDRDYVALDAFANKHDLDFNDQYKPYRSIFYASGYYRNIYKGILEVAFVAKDTSNMYYAGELSKNVNTFYEELTRTYYDESEDISKVEGVHAEMEADLQILLQKYLGLTAEETASMKALSKSKRTVMIEQAIDERLVSVTGMGLQQMQTTELPQIGATLEEVE